MTEVDDSHPNEPQPDLSKITDRLRGPLGFVAIGIGILSAIALLPVSGLGVYQLAGPASEWLERAPGR